MHSDTSAMPTSTYYVQTRFGETDLMGVVHHATYLLYCEAARVDWLHKRGVSYQSWIAHGIQLPVVETELHYKRAAHFDDILAVTTTMDALTGVTVSFRYEIKHDDVLICSARTKLASVGDNLKLKRIPSEIADVLRSTELPEAQWAPRAPR